MKNNMVKKSSGPVSGIIFIHSTVSVEDLTGMLRQYYTEIVPTGKLNECLMKKHMCKNVFQEFLSFFNLHN